MKSDYQPIVGHLFKTGVIYRVPLYQRHYVWDNINWEHLWEDIKEKSILRRVKSPKQHFTGAIVLQEIVPDALLEIIDGQQRLTTFQIVLCAIGDICDEFEYLKKVQGTPDPYNRYIYLKSIDIKPIIRRKLRSDERQCKLLPREGTDRDVFLSLVKKKQEQVENNGPIWKAYEYFKDEIKEYVTDDHGKLDLDKLDCLYKSIVNDFMVVAIEVTSDDEYAKIFKSINGTGRRLDQFDLLRNDLFLRSGVTERDNLYRTYWCHFEENSDWRKDKVVDNFLEDFLKVKLGEDFSDQLSLFDQYELYCPKLTKELKLSETDSRLVKYEFYDLNRYSRIYHDMNISNSGEIGNRFKFYDEFNDQLKVKDQLKLFILSIATEFGLSIRELNRIFNLFEAYVLRAMLYIGSRNYSYNLPPLKKLNSLFLRALELNRKESLSFMGLVYLLSAEWVTDQEVKDTLDRLPQTKATRKKSKSNLMLEFGGSYIFDVLGESIDHETELFDKFCEKWPSDEAMLQKEFIGDLPIVYSRIPVSVETIDHLRLDSEDYVSVQAKPRLENYVFVTYQGMRVLSDYETDESCVTGVEVNSAAEDILDLKEILFAFPTIAMSSLENNINSIQNDVKNQKLQPVSRQDAFSTKCWLFDQTLDLQTRVENSNSNHWCLPDIEAIVVTRAGHELNGKLKSFNDNAIYMEINDHIVTVYMHGIFKLERVRRAHKRKN